MRVEILKPVSLVGQVVRSGVCEGPDSSARYWIAIGAARLPVDGAPNENEPADTPAPAAASGRKSRL